ncbi:5'-3' exonuclease [Paraburkholderia sp. GAS32]|uniref:5'-3' exonuclease n=1 Tax=Paraburkholderia sp. GAS32 TaxID=3035129 RepID=UPI003D225564
MNAQTQGKERLLLIDGTAIVRRVYEKNARDNPNQPLEQTAEQSIRFALGSFRKALEEVPHTHALAAFDYGGKNWRHRLFPAYKDGREPMAQELRDRLPDFYCELRSRHGLYSNAVPGVEADDVIGTCARRWLEAEKGEVVVSAHDKDMLWLIAHGVLIYHYFDHCYRDRAYVNERFYGLEPSQILDFLALMGDSTDGVPGIDRCGAKTAAAWLNEFGTLAGVIENAEALPGIAGKSLRANIEQVRLNRQLVSLASNVQLGLTWKELRRVQN